MQKEEQYQNLLRQAHSIVNNESDLIANMSNIAALLHATFHFWWTGFYRVVESELVLGPFQGSLACTRIAHGRGVCGTAWAERRSIVVEDVEQFPGLIACSSASRSEIVVPIFSEGQVVGVLDIDSQYLSTFDEVDRLWLERLVAVLMGGEKELWLAAGCFWGAEHYLKLLDGVIFTETGYANGNSPNPIYQEVYTDTTGYAESVHLCYNRHRIPLTDIVEMYFKSIDPTSLNQQGADRGTRYRTGIYYTDPADREVILQIYKAEAQKHPLPLQVEVQTLTNFYRAEEYHQDYLAKNPSGYCHLPEALFELARNHRRK